MLLDTLAADIRAHGRPTRGEVAAEWNQYKTVEVEPSRGALVSRRTFSLRLGYSAVHETPNSECPRPGLSGITLLKVVSSPFEMLG